MREHNHVPKNTEATTQSQFQKALPSQTHHIYEIIQRAQMDPSTLSQGDILVLHRTIGNQAVGRLLQKKEQLAKKAEETPIQRSSYFKEQSDLWKKLESAEGRQEHAHGLTSVGFEYDVGFMEQGNPLKGVSHLELMKAELKNAPAPFVMETDAGSTLEVATAPYLLETPKGKPWPTPEALDKALDANKNALNKMPENTTIDETATKLGEGFGIDWQRKNLKIKPTNLSTKANPEEANKAVENPQGVWDIAVEKRSESPQINILTDMAHIEALDDPEKTRVPHLKYYQLFKGINDTASQALSQHLENYEEISKEKLSARIATTIVHQAIVAPLQGALIEYQKVLEQKPLDNADKNKFEHIAALTSFVKDYTNIWLKTDLVTYLRGSLTPNDKNSLEATLKTKKDQILSSMQVTTDDLLQFFSRPKLQLYFPMKQIFEKYVAKVDNFFPTAAAKVIDTLAQELQKVPSGDKERPGLYELNMDLLGARHDTYLEPSKANEVADKLGYLRGKLHLIEIRSKSDITLSEGASEKIKGSHTGSKEVLEKEKEVREIKQEIQKTVDTPNITKLLQEIEQEPSQDVQIERLKKLLDKITMSSV